VSLCLCFFLSGNIPVFFQPFPDVTNGNNITRGEMVMKSLVSICTALILIFASQTSVMGATLNRPVTQSEADTVARKTKSALEFLDQFWAGVVSARGVRFARPGLQTMSNGHAYYNVEDHTIYVNPDFFVERMRAAAEQTNTDGDMAFIVILAHEYGHSVQRQLGMMNGNCIVEELQADRMAGAFAAAALQQGKLDAGDLDEATYTFFTGRDDTNGVSQCPHGSGTQRVDAFHAGLKGGINAALAR